MARRPPSPTASPPVKPEVVHLHVGGALLASAHPRTPPGARSPDWYWSMYRRVGAKTTWVGLGRMPRDAVASALAACWRGGDPNIRDSPIEPLEQRDQPLGAPARSTLSLCRIWFAHQEDRRAQPLAPNTLLIYRRTCELVRDARLGNLLLPALTDPALADFVEELRGPGLRRKREKARHAQARLQGKKARGPLAKGRGYSVRTINHCLQVLSIILGWGRDQGMRIPPVEPMRFQIRQKPGMKESVYRSHLPEDGDLQAFVDGLPHGSLRLALQVAWRSGLRVGELTALRWCDLGRSPHGWILAAGANPNADGNRKTGIRRAPLPDDVADALLAARPAQATDTSLIFGGATKDDLGGALVAAQTRQGRPRDRQFTFKGLRSRWSHDMVSAGVPLQVYVDISGHSLPTALKHYARVSDRDRHTALLRVDESGRANRLFDFLAERKLSPAQAIALLELALEERAGRGEHLGLAPKVG